MFYRHVSFLRNYVEKAKSVLASQEITGTLWRLTAHYVFTGACQLFIPSARRLYSTKQVCVCRRG